MRKGMDEVKIRKEELEYGFLIGGVRERGEEEREEERKEKR